jgi:hypothetical protein
MSTSSNSFTVYVLYRKDLSNMSNLKIDKNGLINTGNNEEYEFMNISIYATFAGARDDAVDDACGMAWSDNGDYWWQNPGFEYLKKNNYSFPMGNDDGDDEARVAAKEAFKNYAIEGLNKTSTITLKTVWRKGTRICWKIVATDVRAEKK